MRFLPLIPLCSLLAPHPSLAPAPPQISGGSLLTKVLFILALNVKLFFLFPLAGLSLSLFFF